jgi:tetratricopeptide (TPR) repeat protein
MEYHITSELVDPKYRNQWIGVCYNNLGLAYEHGGNLYLAQETYQKAVTFNPSLDFAWYNLALVAVRRNDTSTAASSRERLRTINPLLEQKIADTIRKL